MLNFYIIFKFIMGGKRYIGNNGDERVLAQPLPSTVHLQKRRENWSFIWLWSIELKLTTFLIIVFIMYLLLKQYIQRILDFTFKKSLKDKRL